MPSAAGGFFSFGITNRSHLGILYTACPAQAKSNGMWLEVHPPSHGPITSLPAGKAGTLVVRAPLPGEVWRVPVLWCYGPTKVQFLKRRAQKFLGKLFLLGPGTSDADFIPVSYTNYSAEITS
jgi:hypothetical protein